MLLWRALQSTPPNLSVEETFWIAFVIFVVEFAYEWVNVGYVHNIQHLRAFRAANDGAKAGFIGAVAVLLFTNWFYFIIPQLAGEWFATFLRIKLIKHQKQ